MRILAISGSLRARSSNSLLILAAQALAPTGVEIRNFEGIGQLPYFNPDLDGDSPPPEVRAFREKVTEADALLISTPEYAHGIPGVLKNALDWLVSDTQFAGKRVGIISGSATDGSFAQKALIEVLNTMSANVVPEAVTCISGVRMKFDSRGQLSDAQVEAGLRKVLIALSAPVV